MFLGFYTAKMFLTSFEVNGLFVQTVKSAGSFRSYYHLYVTGSRFKITYASEKHVVEDNILFTNPRQEV